MNISITKFRKRCLEIIRRVEANGTPVTITRRGKVIAQLAPPRAVAESGLKPWERLRGRARWLAAAGERFISEKDVQGL
jgi:prevent-host-death family protein